MRSVVLMRHGETDWNREGRIMGAENVPLNPLGREQCRGVAALLERFEIDAVVTSPLARARESADIIATRLGIEIFEDVDLEEVHFGSWQGRTYKEIIADPIYHRFARDPEATATPGGETIRDVQRRGVAAIERERASTRTLFVSHGDIIRSAICHFSGLPLRRYRRIRVDNCGLSALAFRPDAIEVKFLNLLADPERAWEALHWHGASRGG